MNRRTIVRAAGCLLATAGLAGCLGGRSDGGTATPHPSESPTATETDTPVPTATDTENPGTPADSPTAAPDGPGTGQHASEQADPDLPILGQNDDDLAHTVSLSVVNDAETVHEGTHELAPGESRSLYNLRESDPDGIEEFTISARLGDQTAVDHVRTDDCHGAVNLWIDESGELALFHSIC